MGKRKRKTKVEWVHPVYKELHETDKQIEGLREKIRTIHVVPWQRWAESQMDRLLARRSDLMKEVQRIWHEERAKKDGLQS